MTAGSLATFFVLALVDSINPSALIVTLHLLGRNAPLGAILVYIGTVFVTYLGVSILLVLGLTSVMEPLQAFLATRAANIGLAILGGGMLAWALFTRKPKGDRAEKPFTANTTTVSGLVALGVSVTLLELPTAVPLLAAAGLISAAEQAVTTWLPLLIAYNLIFIAPPVLLTFGYRWLGAKGGERLRERLSSGARETMLWIIGIVGFYLLMQALEALGVLGDSISVG